MLLRQSPATSLGFGRCGDNKKSWPFLEQKFIASLQQGRQFQLWGPALWIFHWRRNCSRRLAMNIFAVMHG